MSNPLPRSRFLLLGNQEIPIGGNLTRGIKGIIYLCPTCGTSWARAELYPVGKYMFACYSPCVEHGDPHHPGGCVLNPLLWWDEGTPKGNPDFLKTLSPELLRYSVLRKIDQILKD